MDQTFKKLKDLYKQSHDDQLKLQKITDIHKFATKDLEREFKVTTKIGEDFKLIKDYIDTLKKEARGQVSQVLDLESVMIKFAENEAAILPQVIVRRYLDNPARYNSQIVSKAASVENTSSPVRTPTLDSSVRGVNINLGNKFLVNQHPKL